MKKLFICILLQLLLCIYGCNNKPAIYPNEVTTNETTTPQLAICLMPQIFTTMNELQEFINNPALNDVTEAERTELLKKAALTEITLEGYSLSQIYYRPGTYIAAYYTDDDYVYTDKYDEMEHERLSTAICEVFLFDNADAALTLNYINYGYKPVIIDGKQYYYKIEYSLNDVAMGYNLAFVKDDCLMYVHLPYTGIFKELPQDAT